MERLEAFGELTLVSAFNAGFDFTYEGTKNLALKVRYVPEKALRRAGAGRRCGSEDPTAEGDQSYTRAR